jgi:hypothetical protein
MVERNVLESNLMAFLAATGVIIGPSQEFRMRRRKIPLLKKKKCARGVKTGSNWEAHTAIPPRNNRFTI